MRPFTSFFPRLGIWTKCLFIYVQPWNNLAAVRLFICLFACGEYARPLDTKNNNISIYLKFGFFLHLISTYNNFIFRRPCFESHLSFCKVLWIKLDLIEYKDLQKIFGSAKVFFGNHYITQKCVMDQYFKNRFKMEKERKQMKTSKESIFYLPWSDLWVPIKHYKQNRSESRTPCSHSSTKKTFKICSFEYFSSQHMKFI